MGARLEGQLGQLPEWMHLVQECSHAGVDMQAKASYSGKAEGSGTANLPGASGDKFQYVSFGAALAHVQLDGLTGELQLLRCDVLLDCGISLNPDIDAGQVQGAFVMGLGYMLSEEFLWDDGSKSAYFPAGGVAGQNLSNGTWEYKPHFSLACCVLFAAQHAIATLRGDGKHVPLIAPATVDKLFLASGIDPSQFKITS